VLTEFGKGIKVPLLKQDSNGNGSRIEDYRGITILQVISKVFEFILLKFAGPTLGCSVAQIGYRKRHGCAHAIYTVRKTIEYFTTNLSSVSVCALDISKAFDKVNHTLLYSVLMDRNVQAKLILVLSCWYDNAAICVRWGVLFVKICNFIFRCSTRWSTLTFSI